MSSAPYYATDSAPRSLLEEQAGEAAAGTEMVVILEKMLTLPQPVDDAGITCSYSDGLLRIEIPIVAPADTEREQELVKLQEDISQKRTLTNRLNEHLKSSQGDAETSSNIAAIRWRIDKLKQSCGEEQTQLDIGICLHHVIEYFWLFLWCHSRSLKVL